MPPKAGAKGGAKGGQKGGSPEKKVKLTKKELEEQKHQVMLQAKAKLWMAENISRHIAATMARARYEEIKRDYIMEMATNIQRVWRGHGPRRLMSTFAFPGHSRAATKLSSVYRGHYARVRVRLGYNPKCEAAAAVLQKAYRSSVTRDILKVLRSVRCVPLSMALAGIAMYPSPRLLIEPDVAAMRALYLRTGELCTSFLNQTDLWVRRAFRYLQDENGDLEKKSLHHVMACARVDADLMMEHCLAFVAEARSSTPERASSGSVAISEEEFVEAFARCRAFFKGEMVADMSDPFDDGGVDEYDVFCEMLAKELEAIYSLDDESRAQALIKMPRVQRGRVLRRIDATSLGKAIYAMDARETRFIRKHQSELDTERDEESELREAKLIKVITHQFKFYTQDRSPLRLWVPSHDVDAELVGELHRAQYPAQERYHGGLFQLVRHPMLCEGKGFEVYRRDAMSVAETEVKAARLEAEYAFHKADVLRKRGIFEHAEALMELAYETFEYACRIECEAKIFFPGGKWDQIQISGEGGTGELYEQFKERLATARAEFAAHKSPLHDAAKQGNVGTIKYLIDGGHASRLDAIDMIGRTPLHVAVAAGRHAAVKSLVLEHGASLDPETFAGRTPLHVAADGGDPGMVKMLFECAAVAVQRDSVRVNKRDVRKAEVGRLCSIKLGCGICTSTGNTALDLAVAKGDAKVIEVVDRIFKEMPKEVPKDRLPIEPHPLHWGANEAPRHPNEAPGDPRDHSARNPTGSLAPFAPSMHPTPDPNTPEEEQDPLAMSLRVRYYEEEVALRTHLSRVGRPYTASSQGSTAGTGSLAMLLGQYDVKLVIERGSDILYMGKRPGAKRVVTVTHEADGDSSIRTRGAKCSPDPEFGDEFTFRIDPDGDKAGWNVLELVVWEEVAGEEPLFLGRSQIDVSDLRFGVTESVFHLYDSDDFRPQHLLRERLFVGHIRPLPPISGCLDVTMVVKNEFSHFPPVPPGGAFRLFLETELPSVCDDHPSADKDERLEIIKQRYNHEVEEDPELPSKFEAQVKHIQADYTVKMSEILIASIIKGHVPSVAECMRRKTDPDSLNQKRNSALFVAAHTGHVGTIQLLLEGGASPDFQSPEESITPLIEAASNNHHLAVSTLLKGNANPDLKTRGGTTALMAAATKGYDRVVRAILEHGCDINIGNSVGATALHLAAMTEMGQCVALLLEGGADTKIRVHSGKLEGRKAIEVAMEPSTVKVFKNHRKGLSRLLGMDL